MQGMSMQQPESATLIPRNMSALLAAWFVLLVTGMTSVTFNVWHATHSGRMPLGLALLIGVTPVATAMGASHMVSEHKGGKALQLICYGGMVAAMAQSIGAIAAVIGPVDGPVFRWIFGVAMDVLSLAALRVVIVQNQRHTASEAAARATEEAARRAAEEAAQRATEEPSKVPSQEPRREAARGPQRGTPRTLREPDAESARRAYRESVKAGQPLSDRALGAQFGKSRTWGKNRIDEVKTGPQLAAAQ